MIKMVRIPRILMEHEYYRNLSDRAKVLYGILSEKKQEAVKHGWVDEQGLLYVVFPKRLMQEELACSRYRLDLVTKELVATDLIELTYGIGTSLERRIYVHNFKEECPWIRVEYGIRDNRTDHPGEAAKQKRESDPNKGSAKQKEDEDIGGNKADGVGEKDCAADPHPEQKEHVKNCGRPDPLDILKFLMESGEKGPEPEEVSWPDLLSALAAVLE